MITILLNVFQLHYHKHYIIFPRDMEIRVGLSVPDNKTSPRELCSIQNKNSPGTVICVKNSNRMQCRRVERALGYRSRDAVLMFQHERVDAINGETPLFRILRIGS